MLFTRDLNHEQEKVAAGAAGIAIYLALLEFLIPKPLPFLRFGFANIPLVVLAGKLKFKYFMLFTFIKLVGTVILTGTIFSPVTIISIVGTFSSGVTMFAIKKLFKDKVGFIGVSVASAFISDLCRIFVASLILWSKDIIFALPVILIFGLCSSIFVGIFSNIFSRHNDFFNLNLVPKGGSILESQIMGKSKDNRLIFIYTLLISICYAIVPNIGVQAIMFLFLIALFYILKRKLKLGLTMAVFCSIVFFNLLSPSGRVLFHVFSFPIGLDSLILGVDKALTFCGLTLISLLFMKNSIVVPTKIGNIISYSMQCLMHLTQLKVPVKEIFRYDYISNLNNVGELEINKKVVEKNLSITIKVFVLFFVLFIISLFYYIASYFIIS